MIRRRLIPARTHIGYALLFSIAAGSATVSAQGMRQLPTDPWQGDDPYMFESATPQSVSLDDAQLAEAAMIAEAGNSDSLVVIRNGKLVYEKYWNDKKQSDLQQMYSATKSPFAFVVGRAIQKGYIKGLDQPIVDILPEIAGGGRDALTFRNIMAMESGLEQARETDEDDAEKLRSQYESAVRRKVTKEPYSFYHYNNAAYRILFTALERASGMSIPELTRQELFEPLGMQGAYWVELHANDELKGYQSIRMRPVDLAKVAQVMLNKGTWGGKPYLDASYIKAMATAASAKANPSYGLFWHLNSGDFYLTYYDSDREEGNLMPGTPPDAVANYGSRGQLIVAIPSLSLVWIRTGQNIPSTIWERNSFVTKLSAAVVKAAK